MRDKCSQAGERRVGVEVFQKVAEVFRFLPHYRCGHDYAQCVERGGSAVPVRVSNELGLQHAVIVGGSDGVTHRVARPDDEQIVPVVVHYRTVIEGIGDLARQVEMLTCCGQLLRCSGRRVGHVGGRVEEDPA